MSTASPRESIVTGGEVAFVKQIIIDSLKLKNRVRYMRKNNLIVSVIVVCDTYFMFVGNLRFHVDLVPHIRVNIM